MPLESLRVPISGPLRPEADRAYTAAGGLGDSVKLLNQDVVKADSHHIGFD